MEKIKIITFTTNSIDRMSRVMYWAAFTILCYKRTLKAFVFLFLFVHFFRGLQAVSFFVIISGRLRRNQWTN
jgi:hypothetical protein